MGREYLVKRIVNIKEIDEYGRRCFRFDKVLWFVGRGGFFCKCDGSYWKFLKREMMCFGFF